MNITNLLGIKYPLIQGSMARISRHELVSAVSNAGGLGVLTSVGMDKTELRSQIDQVRNETDRPFGVNLMLQQSNIPDMVDVLVEKKVPVVMTGAGTPAPFYESLHNVGSKVIPVIPNVDIAKKMEQLGVDAVVAEGMESGGHIGQMTTMTLVPQVADAVNIPVIAAGGIGDRRAVAAALVLGAQGVQVGTAFLVAQEAPISQAYKQMVLNATDTSTAITGTTLGDPVRSLKNDLVNQIVKMEQSGSTVQELRDLLDGSLQKAIYDGNTESGSFMAGEIAGEINEILPAKEIIQRMFS
jgi:enoyl-[acyl-carrier protein] reductase II